jgi:hypothetical protein
MTKDKLYPILVNIYTDYFDGLYTEQQLKFMLKKLHVEDPKFSSNEFAQFCLDAQWENATDKDYEETRKINEIGSDRDNRGLFEMVILQRKKYNWKKLIQFMLTV